MTLSPHRLTDAGRAAVLVLAAVACCATPNRAAAGCGDYVAIRTADDETAPHHQPGTPPCHGPHCSATPDVPAPASAPVVSTTSRVKDSAHTLVGVDGDPRPAEAFGPDPTSPRPIRRASAVFHPPRP